MHASDSLLENIQEKQRTCTTFQIKPKQNQMQKYINIYYNDARVYFCTFSGGPKSSLTSADCSTT